LKFFFLAAFFSAFSFAFWAASSFSLVIMSGVSRLMFPRVPVRYSLMMILLTLSRSMRPPVFLQPRCWPIVSRVISGSGLISSSLYLFFSSLLYFCDVYSIR